MRIVSPFSKSAWSIGSLGVLAMVTGCGSGSKTVPSTPVPLFATGTTTMTVVLPVGSSLTPDKTTVETSVGIARPAPNGAVSVPVYVDDPQIAIVLTPAGNPILLGWVDPLHTTISSSTTAEVLGYYALGGYLTLNEDDRVSMEKTIPQAPGFPALAQVVESEMKGNVDALGPVDANLRDALNAFFTSVTGVKPRAEAPGGVHPHGILITPGIQSGINVIQQPPNAAYMTNTFRRRTHAYVTRVSNTMTGSAPVPDAADVTDFEIPPTGGVSGGVAGTISDIFNAYYGNQATAYGPVDTSASPFMVPLTTGYDKTTYQVTVVGPGNGNYFQLLTLPATQVLEQFKISYYGFVSDALIPFLTNFYFGSGILENAGHQKTATVTKFSADLLTSFQVDLAGLANSLPGLHDQIAMGDYGGAMSNLFSQAVASNSLRTAFIGAVETAKEANLPGQLGVGAGVTAATQVFNKYMNLAGGALQVFDSSVYVAQIYQSDAVDQWTVSVDQAKVTLTPQNPTTSQMASVTLTAALPGVTVTGYTYYWTTTGTAGTLSEVGGGGRTMQTAFCSSSPQVNYVPNPTPALAAAATDTVTVQASSASQCAVTGFVGSAVSTTVSITPQQDYTLYGGPEAPRFQCGTTPGSPIFINDSLYLSLNNNLVFTQHGAGCSVNSIALPGAKKGDAVEVVVTDEGGAGTGLSQLFILVGGKFVMVEPGFSRDTPPGNNGEQYRHTFYLP